MYKYLIINDRVILIMIMITITITIMIMIMIMIMITIDHSPNGAFQGQYKQNYGG